MLEALTHLHTLTPQVLHRDVKPSNILLDYGDHAYLADIGMAKEANEQQREQTHLSTAVVRGTPGFVDPLISNGLQHSPLTDGFAFAITTLIALVALPPVNIEYKCRLMLRHPTVPERWQSPGVPDVDASWPSHVVSLLA